MQLKRNFLYILFILAGFSAFSQEALKSTEEEYYDFLSLDGTVSRNTLGYRTLSDSVWNFSAAENVSFDKHVWSEKKLATSFTIFTPAEPKTNFFANGINQSVSLRIYGPEWFNSYNTAAPFGQNDGALWQGRGYNTSFTAGARLEAYGFELTFKPQVSFSQNKYFDIMTSAYTSEYGYFWSYGKCIGCDAPQRFGDSSFWTFDWGDSEIRYTFYNFTVGFGTQIPWLGPAHENPILGSNNAPSYPKLDFGLRRTAITIPWVNWYIGDLEFRYWLGYLSESDYFDDNEENDHNMITGLTISFAPSLLPGLTIGVNKINVCKWMDHYYWYVNPFYVGNAQTKGLGEDGKASVIASWLFDKAGAEVYAEVGVDDFLPDGLKFYEYARYPFHTLAYTVGLKKSFDISKKNKVYGMLNFEWNCTELSEDFQMWHKYNFGFHSEISQGYTNRGQWLGSGIGYGGNSQVLSFTIYSPHGFDKLLIGRNNPDNNYIFCKRIDTSVAKLSSEYFTAFKANFYVGAESLWYITKSFSVKGTFVYDLIINPLYNPGYSYTGTNGLKYYREHTSWNNFNFDLTLKYIF